MSTEALLVGIHLLTGHFASATASDLESVTPGIYVRTEAGATAGLYRNSNGKASAYLGWTWTTRDGRFALTAGGVTGYEGAPVYPLLVPSMAFELDQRWKLRLAALPKPHSHGAAGVHLSVEVQW